MLLDILRWATFEGHVVRRVDCIDHVDGVPRANLGAMLAADTTIQVDVAPGLQRSMFLAFDLIDTIDRTDFNARFAAGASVGMDHSQNLGNDLARFTCQGRCCHVHTSRVYIARHLREIECPRTPRSKQSS